MAKYKIPNSVGAWISPFDGKTYGGGAEVVVPDTFEPSIHWIPDPEDEAAKENHAAQVKLKAAIKKEQEDAAKAGLTWEEALHQKKLAADRQALADKTKESETI